MMARRKRKARDMSDWKKFMFGLGFVLVLVISYSYVNFAAWSFGGGLTLGLDYRYISVDGETIWDAVDGNIGPVDVISGTGNSIMFDMDAHVLYGAGTSPILREGSPQAEVQISFGDIRPIDKYGDEQEIIQEGDSIVTYEDPYVDDTDIKHTKYKLRIAINVGTAGGPLPIIGGQYTTEGNPTTVDTYIPPCREQQVDVGYALYTILGTYMTAETGFRILNVEPVLVEEEFSRLINGETWDGFTYPTNAPYDVPILSSPEEIQIVLPSIVVEGTDNVEFIIKFDVAPGAVFDVDADEWEMLQVALNFDLEVDLELTQQYYNDARWEGSFVGDMLAKLPAGLSWRSLDDPLIQKVGIGFMIGMIALGVVTWKLLKDRWTIKTKSGGGDRTGYPRTIGPPTS